MKRYALVGAVDFNYEDFSQRSFDGVVAVDRGYAKLASWGIVPDVALGDFDSLGFVPRAARVETFPAAKDESDMELACSLALDDGADELVLYGCLSRRLDHTLANIQLLAGLARRGAVALGVGAGFALCVLDAAACATARLSFPALDAAALDAGPYGRFLSVFAYGGPATVSEAGLRWELDRAALLDDVSRGLSNEFTGAPAAIEVHAGNVVVTAADAAFRRARRG
ncbi:MAG: thiamine diphosphokinase [Denitrobacterium sp.]|jgi:thiamine pyrophosphokinase|nr:thiamine diphosphokinase [Denitrobacterium sp.]MCI1480508.1 thiamine diphosphokinase [Eggerthellaceae bacterium]